MIQKMVVLAIVGAVGFAIYFSDRYTLIELIVGGVVAVCFTLIFTLPASLILDEKAQDLTEAMYKREETRPPVRPDENGRLVCKCGAPVLIVDKRIYYGCECGKKG